MTTATTSPTTAELKTLQLQCTLMTMTTTTPTTAEPKTLQLQCTLRGIALKRWVRYGHQYIGEQIDYKYRKNDEGNNGLRQYLHCHKTIISRAPPPDVVPGVLVVSPLVYSPSVVKTAEENTNVAPPS